MNVPSLKDDQRLLHQKVTIQKLHDDVLLAIFILCINRINRFHETDSDAWQTLVHVCQKWRHLIFSFPDHLNVRLRCSRQKPVTETLRVWPALPIIVLGDADDIDEADHIVVALEQRDRVREISLYCYPCFPLETVLSAMLVPFPALKRLFVMATEDVRAPVFPDTFLGGSAPCLQFLYLHGIPFPTLPNLLLSARDLVDLRLSDICRSGSFLPEELVNSISNLFRLETLSLRFRSRRTCPVPGTRSPPMARAVFPALDLLLFEGVSEYLVDLVSRIDAPLIRRLDMTFLNQPSLSPDFCELREFIDRAEKFKSLTHAHIDFSIRTAEISLSEQTHTYYPLSVRILCNKLYPWLGSLSQVCSASLLPLSRVDTLRVTTSSGLMKCLLLREHTEDARWLNILQPFSAVKNLYLDESTLPSLAYALKEVPEERVTEVLPALVGLTMEPSPLDDSFSDPSPPAVQEAIDRFMVMRRLPPTCVVPNNSYTWLGD